MARSGYEPKSKYLRMYHETFYDYWYLSFERYTTFDKGQEKEFQEAINEMESYYKNHGGHMDAVAEDDIRSLMEDCDFNWKKIWKEVDLRKFCGPLNDYIETLAHYVNWENFKEKVNTCNNIEIVERLFYVYCRWHEIKNSKRDKAYGEYLTHALKRKKKSPENVLCEMIHDYEDIFERGHGVDTVESFLQASKKRIFRNLLLIANLNTLVDYNDKKVSLKNLLLYRILKYGDASGWISEDRKKPDLDIDNEEELKELFDACDDLTFTGEPLDDKFIEYDRATLNIMMNEEDKAYKAFNDRNYSLYNQNEIESLLENGVYQNTDTPFTDRFARIIRFLCLKNSKALLPEGVNHDDFIYYIYNYKIKVISYPTLMTIKNYLTEKEYQSYLNHLKEENIQVYFGDYLGLHGDKSRIITYGNTSDLNPFEKYESRKIQKELNSKVYKK